MHKEYHSNGKLLLSGEYAVLDGAVGLAIPTKYGQSLRVSSADSGILEWTSYTEKGEVWFSCSLSIEGLNPLATADTSISKTLTALLSEAKSQNPSFLGQTEGLRVETHLDFPRNWGLGTSSTLINNIAQWATIDPYKLLWKAFGGSGYDIACAQHNTPILYQLNNGIPKVGKVRFDPPFKDAIQFVYLNQKQSSKEAIAAYRKQQFNKDDLIAAISTITQKMVDCTMLSEFEALMREHEQLLSETLGLPTLKSKLFKDYPGTIKSLGAWGGDFMMVTGTEKNMGYFRSKGYKTIIPLIQMGHSSIG